MIAPIGFDLTQTAALARRITRDASRQTFLTIRWLVDRDLADKAYRAYAYFRWVDDSVDVASKERRTQLAFLARQRKLLQRLSAGDVPGNLPLQEQLLVDLMLTRRDDHPGLCSYLTNMMAVLEFDAARRARLITAQELDRYTQLLSVAIMDALAYFIGHRRRYPPGNARLLAVQGAHIAHMLRDTQDDIALGYINVPREFLEAQHLDPMDLAHPAYRVWVRQRVDLARACFREGKRYLRTMGNVRSQLAGHLYCARFEVVLRQIEMDHYVLRPRYAGLPTASAWLFNLAQARRLSMRATRRADHGDAC